jgi:hypothetical protein
MVIAASQALARRIVEEERGDDLARLDHGFELCLTRHPREDERRLLLSYLHHQTERYRLDKTAAATIAGVNETDSEKPDSVEQLAAWTLVSRALFNLDEAISKE